MIHPVTYNSIYSSPVFGKKITRVADNPNEVATINGSSLAKINTLKSVYFELQNRVNNNNVLAAKMVNGLNNVKFDGSAITVKYEDNKSIKFSVIEVGMNKLFRIKLFEDKELKNMITLDNYRLVERINRNNFTYLTNSMVNKEEITSIIDNVYDVVDEPFLDVRRFIRRKDFDEYTNTQPVQKTVIETKPETVLKPKEIAPGVTADMMPISRQTPTENNKTLYSYSAIIHSNKSKAESLPPKKTVVKENKPKVEKPIVVKVAKKRGRPPKVESNLPKAMFNGMDTLNDLATRISAYKNKMSDAYYVALRRDSGLFDMSKLTGTKFKTPDSNLLLSEIKNKYGQFWKIVDYNDDYTVNESFIIDKSGKIVRNWKPKAPNLQMNREPVFYDVNEVKKNGVDVKIKAKLKIMENNLDSFDKFIESKTNKDNVIEIKPKEGHLPQEHVETVTDIKNSYNVIFNFLKELSFYHFQKIKGNLDITYKNNTLYIGLPDKSKLVLTKMNRKYFDNSDLFNIRIIDSTGKNKFDVVFDENDKIVQNSASLSSSTLKKLRYMNEDEMTSYVNDSYFISTLKFVKEKLANFKSHLNSDNNKYRKKTSQVTKEYKTVNASIKYNEVKNVLDNATFQLDTAISDIKRDFGVINRFNQAVENVKADFEKFLEKFNNNQ